MSEPLISARNVSRNFGGVKAVQDVSLDIQPGQRVGFIGPNGAGKSTFVNCLAGGLPPSGGDVLVDGKSILRLSSQGRSRLGIARTFQNLELFLSMTAFENVLVAIDGTSRIGSSLRPGHARRARARAMEALAMLGIEGYADIPTGALPYGIRKLVELSRAFVTEPRLLLLDEPVAGLSDTEEFLDVLSEGIDQLGCGVLLVEHDMSAVRRLCEVVHVLEGGRLIASGSYEEIARDPHVIEAYLGAPSG
jgi:ABC-type branched-subunit amino acid transport system ATPase component